jgi:hypothetical protein
MPRRPKHQPSEISQYEGASAATEVSGEIIEYDETVPEAAGLAQVEDVGDAPSVTEVDEAMFKALASLEQRLGGFESIAASFADRDEKPATGLENIVGFGIGENSVNGRYTGDLALKVYVEEKLPLSQLETNAIVPPELEGYPTDVEEVGVVYAESFRRRYRPAPGGSSIGHPAITAGTHGCLVVLNNNRLCCLSNNHVLADSNRANIGDAILQPGPADGGSNPADRVGVLQAFVPINFAGGANAVDAAVAWTSFANLSGGHHCYQINPTPLQAGLNMTVRKCGRTTQHTLGIITGVGVSVRVDYRSAGVAVFRNQLQIRGIGRDFSQGGDSGSLVVSAGTHQPVGLLFAGGNGVTFANPINAVIAALGIQRFLN